MYEPALKLETPKETYQFHMGYKKATKNVHMFSL